MKNFKKFVFFFLVLFCILGTIGGVLIAICKREYVVAVGVAALAYTAWPKFKEYLIYLTI